MKKKPKGADGLSVQAVVDAAIRYIDQNGLEKLTMRALAADMGVYPTALYWYVDSKSRLIGLATNVVMSQAGHVSREGTWDDRLRAIARELRDNLHDHPNFASVLASQIMLEADGYAARVDGVLAALDAAGFQGESVTHAFNTFVGSVTGWVCMELSSQPPAEARGANWPETFSRSLARQSTVDFPSLAKYLPQLANRAFMARWESGVSSPLDESFEFMLSTLLSGLAAQLTAGRREEALPAG